MRRPEVAPTTAAPCTSNRFDVQAALAALRAAYVIHRRGNFIGTGNAAQMEFRVGAIAGRNGDGAHPKQPLDQPLPDGDIVDVDRFHAIVLPKTNTPEDIIHLSRLLDAYEKQAGWTTTVQIEALIETPLAIVNAYAIAMASERMAGLIFGIADFSASMGVREMIVDQNKNFHYAKQATVAKVGGPDAPLQLAVVDQRPWYTSPVTWGVAGAVLVGVASVVYWYASEAAGAGDLRPYALVQFVPLVLIPLLLASGPPAYTRGGDLLVVLGWYVVAKLFEQADAAVFAAGGLVSGHTLKHLAAAAGAWWLLRMVRSRRPA